MAATDFDDHYERITLHRWNDLWIATDEQREISSSPMETRAEALDDLDECVALREGSLQFSEKSDRTVDHSRRDFEEGQYTSLEDA